MRNLAVTIATLVFAASAAFATVGGLMLWRSLRRRTQVVA